MAATDKVNLERIRLADYNLNACGVPTLPDGSRFVDIPKTLVYNNVILANQFLPDERQGTQSNTLFMLGSIQTQFQNQNIGIMVRFQWPNGRYLQNAPVLFNAAYGFGATRKSLRYPVEVPPGEQIRIYLQNTTASATPILIAFEGWLRYYLAPGQSPACCVERL